MFEYGGASCNCHLLLDVVGCYASPCNCHSLKHIFTSCSRFCLVPCSIFVHLRAKPKSLKFLISQLLGGKTPIPSQRGLIDCE